MNLHNLYAWIKRNAQHWLDLCGITSEAVFEKFYTERRMSYVTIDCGVVLYEISFDGITVVVHPLISNRAAFFDRKRALGYLGGICTYTGASRVEARVLQNSSRALRRILKHLGFVHEGTLRQAARDMLVPGKPLIDIEIWSILHVEILEVTDGRPD